MCYAARIVAVEPLQDRRQGRLHDLPEFPQGVSGTFVDAHEAQAGIPVLAGIDSQRRCRVGIGPRSSVAHPNSLSFAQLLCSMDSFAPRLLEVLGMRPKKNAPPIDDAAEIGDRRLLGPGPCASCSLRSCSRFLRLRAEQQAVIARLLRKQESVPEKAEIITAGKPADLYTLYDGWACRYIVLPDGRRQIVHFLLPGDTIGLDGALFGEVNYSVMMLTSGVLCSFGRQTIGTLLETSPEFGKYLLTSAVAEIRTLEQRILALGRKSAVERVAFQLLELYVRLDAINRTASGSRSCSFPLTQRHLADATGLTPTHVNSTLQHLRGEGVVSLSGRLLTIHDLPRLRALACAGEPAWEPRLLL